MHTKTIEIFTDGSCKGNPGPGGWAALLLDEFALKPFMIVKGHEAETTNNRMEMIAAIESLRYLYENHLQNHTIVLYSDSRLLVETLNKNWKRKANLDLWEELDELNEEFNVTYVWVRGHAHNKWNNECDKIAVQEAVKVLKKKKQQRILQHQERKTAQVKNLTKQENKTLF